MLRKRYSSIVTAIPLLFIAFLSQAEPTSTVLPIASFSEKNLQDWEAKEFDNETHYSFTSIDGKTALKADSSDAASGMFREIKVDLKQYPYLNWSWRIEKAFTEIDETQKQFDDYVARIYVVKSGGLFFWKTKALNYVWSSRATQNASWPNAYAPDNAQMLAVRTSHDKAGNWYQEKRNVYEDLKAWLGEEVNEIDGLAIMTDTDNTGGKATAYYGDIYFSAE